MAVLAKNKPNAFVIGTTNAKDFITESNKNTITPSFLAKCTSSSSLFKKS
ncbi:MAG: hypothetical protein ACRC68_08255 [Clostridium sp.]